MLVDAENLHEKLKPNVKFPILQFSIEMNGIKLILPISRLNVTTTLI